MISLQECAIGLAIGLVVGSLGAWHLRGVEADRDLLALAKTFETAVQVAQEEARAEERRRYDAIKTIAGDARNEIENLGPIFSAGADVSVSLQHAASVYAAGASCDPGVARRGAAATEAAILLSDMLSQCSARAAGLAQYADKARIAGSTCERAADAIAGQSSTQ